MEAPTVLIPEAELLTVVIKKKRRVSLMKALLLVVLGEDYAYAGGLGVVVIRDVRS